MYLGIFGRHLLVEVRKSSTRIFKVGSESYNSAVSGFLSHIIKCTNLFHSRIKNWRTLLHLSFSLSLHGDYWRDYKMSLGHTSSAIHLTGNAVPSTMYVLLSIFPGSSLLSLHFVFLFVQTLQHFACHLFHIVYTVEQSGPPKCDHSARCTLHHSRPLSPTHRSTRPSDWYALRTKNWERGWDQDSVRCSAQWDGWTGCSRYGISQNDVWIAS